MSKGLVIAIAVVGAVAIIGIFILILLKFRDNDRKIRRHEQTQDAIIEMSKEIKKKKKKK